MNSPNKILYEHLRDYPTSTERYHKISNRSVAAALCCEHMPDLTEASPEQRPQNVGGIAVHSSLLERGSARSAADQDLN